MEQLADISFVILLFIRCAGQEACLCDIRQNNVRHAAKFCHFFREVAVKRRVHFAVVRHSGVDDNHGVVCFQFVNYGHDGFDLRGGSQVAGVNPVKMEAFLFPVVGNRDDLVV